MGDMVKRRRGLVNRIKNQKKSVILIGKLFSFCGETSQMAYELAYLIAQ
jgi:hypothetical protein